MTKKSKEEFNKELALINGEYGAYFVDDNGKRRTQQEALREVTKDLIRLRDKAKLALSQTLNEIYREEYYKDWGYANFQEYCSKELEFQYRQAKYLVDIWQELNHNRKIPLDVLKKSSWSKLIKLIGPSRVKVVDDTGAEGYAISKDDIIELIENSSTMTVEEVEFKTKELVYEAGKAEKPEETHKLSIKLYKEQYENYKKAISCAEEISGSSKPNANLDLICTSYIASHIPGNPEEELKRLAKMLEKDTGAKILITLDGSIIHANEEFSQEEE